MEITFNAFAFKPSHYEMDDIKAGTEMPYIFAFEANDWPKIGTAVVTVTLFSEDEIHRKELEALNSELQNVRADNQRRENAILQRISKLQALTYVEPA